MYDVWQFSIYEVSFSLSLIKLRYFIYQKKKKTHLSNCIRHVGMVASQLFWKKIFFLLVSFLLQEDISLVALIDEKF